MKMLDALQNIGHLYLDTSPIIYYVEEHPSYIAQMDVLMAHVKQNSIQMICSVMTLTEILPRPIRLGQLQLVKDYREILLNSTEFKLIPVLEKIAESAAQLRATYNLKTPDALHVATAIESGCHAFLTNDLGIKRVIGIRVLVLDELD
ncbi:MAG TPA: type II toxin-antitoxin system VapC family toxin [Aggregatilineales bacterium]|nr:type II toxin-antitoxin system VapC family toxin [Aggregatilineales bacterium]